MQTSRFPLPVAPQVMIARGLLIALLALCHRPLLADDWMTWPSTYTHDPFTGQRVDQYALPVDPVAPAREDFQRSGYRHYRSTLQAGQSVDQMHVVEQWGAPVIPYEAWRFPFRPYSVPYDAWGPQAPYGIINGNLGYGGPGYGGLGYGAPGYGGSGYGGPRYGNSNGSLPPDGGYPGQYDGRRAPSGFPLQPQYQQQPWFDGNYPAAPPLDGRSDQEFFYKPGRQVE